LTRHREGINLSVEAHTKKTSIVIICNHKDENWRTLLEERWGVLVDVWTDRDIGAGEDEHENIKDALRNTSVALLLISADFFGSEFIQKEDIPRLLVRQEGGELRIVPITVAECAVATDRLAEAIASLSTRRKSPRTDEAHAIGDRIEERRYGSCPNNQIAMMNSCPRNRGPYECSGRLH
jgi:hypothetical protein